MKISLEALQVIDAIDRCGTFAEAAEELHKATSSLSYLVQKLESELGVTVFDRTGHRARLTETGRVLVGDGRRLLRAAIDLEERARRVDSGWETELRIAVDAFIPFDILTPYVAAFYGEQSHTQLRFSQEVLSGTWDGLVTNRVDLAVGAVGTPPAVPGVSMAPIGTLETVFAVAPGHPLADVPEPIECAMLSQYRFAEIGENSTLPSFPRPKFVNGQTRLTVPNLHAKLLVLLAGIACGYLPRCSADPHIAAGRLVAKRLCEERPAPIVHLAWRGGESGRALAWWIGQLNRPDFISETTIRSYFVEAAG